MGSSSSTLVEHLPHYLKVEALSPASFTDTVSAYMGSDSITVVEHYLLYFKVKASGGKLDSSSSTVVEEHLPHHL